MPKWVTSVDQFSAMQAAALGILLAAVNPKNLLLAASAGTTIAAGRLSGTEEAAAVAVFTVVAASTVAVPVGAYAVGRKRMAGPLDTLRRWLTKHNVGVMATLLLVIGLVLLEKGLAGLL
jgi:threonine/homoserine/homoserine lactone efflux protein